MNAIQNRIYKRRSLCFTETFHKEAMKLAGLKSNSIFQDIRAQ